ncbi:sarcoplasmic/endoplasmic reticulum calcium ATPase regulator ARLN [Hipposideros larvatus]
MEGGAAAGDGGAGPRERRGQGEAARPPQNHQVQPQPAAARGPKHSYWLDLWLFVLVDLALFVFVYLLPWSSFNPLPPNALLKWKRSPVPSACEPVWLPGRDSMLTTGHIP